MSKNKDESLNQETLEKLNLSQESPKTKELSKGVLNDDSISSELKPLETDHPIINKEENDKIKIVSINESPEYLVDNEYITTGYRLNFNTEFKIIKR